MEGRWAEAERALRRSIELARSFGGTFGEVIGAHRLGLVETAQGRYDAAHERLREALGMARQTDNTMVRAHSVGRILTALARTRYEAGDLPLATEYLALGVAAPQEVGECPGCDVLLYPAAVPIYVALGDHGQAEAACRKAEETGQKYDSPAWVADARYARGLLSLAQESWDTAREALEDALKRYEALGQPYDAARTLEALARLAERAPKDGLDAAALRARAVATYEELGAAGDLHRLEVRRRERRLVKN